jgi:signal peptidase I
MAKDKPQNRRDAASPSAPGDQPYAPYGWTSFLVLRETIESIVVAFVLAFLFRTFEAEAFVIPTGSMSPALLGQHKDVRCPQCGYTYRVTASTEGEETDKARAEISRGINPEQNRQRIFNLQVVGGMCPMCRYLMPMRPDVPRGLLDDIGQEKIPDQPSYPGDRILVNKYGYDFNEPQRWDVVVFKFPGDGNMNFIKRLVGLPGEKLRLFQGNVFTRPIDGNDSQFKIERKPPDKVVAMLQPVHDTDYEPSTLYNAGWPLRWVATTDNGWKVDPNGEGKTVKQTFSVDLAADAPEAWLRYRHLIPHEIAWHIAQRLENDGSLEAVAKEDNKTPQELTEALKETIHPQLIADFNPYNARLTRAYAERDGWRIVPRPAPNVGSLGTEWVDDLAVECSANIQEARGELTLDLVKAGYHFRATVSLSDGKVTLSSIDGRTGSPLDFKAEGQTTLSGTGKHQLRLANVDERLLFWVDGKLVDCGDTTYDADKLFTGGRNGLAPWASRDTAGDQGDLAPVGVAARGAKLEVTRLAVLRDIYYIAARMTGDEQKYGKDDHFINDYNPTVVDRDALFSDPSTWQVLAERQSCDFEVKPGQLFVMGDNSPESKDCRLWALSSTGADQPGGPYLDRKLLIGKAICVFWPHSWGHIPGLPFMPGFPNFRDMRLVR